MFNMTAHPASPVAPTTWGKMYDTADLGSTLPGLERPQGSNWG